LVSEAPEHVVGYVPGELLADAVVEQIGDVVSVLLLPTKPVTV
jgi:hypothetical protein